jgi:hypothetical protein
MMLVFTKMSRSTKPYADLGDNYIWSVPKGVPFQFHLVNFNSTQELSILNFWFKFQIRASNFVLCLDLQVFAVNVCSLLTRNTDMQLSTLPIFISQYSKDFKHKMIMFTFEFCPLLYFNFSYGTISIPELNSCLTISSDNNVRTMIKHWRHIDAMLLCNSNVSWLHLLRNNYGFEDKVVIVQYNDYHFV